ncbi:hypothetical protein BaRGS_00017860 [Batillaria attramentaria]|uniref:Uncharacterized protein n=1 Tax=Batillaria attramentaria TaxID=370345 RepID=A0ABD0KUM3_9CAEN
MTGQHKHPIYFPKHIKTRQTRYTQCTYQRVRQPNPPQTIGQPGPHRRPPSPRSTNADEYDRPRSKRYQLTRLASRNPASSGPTALCYSDRATVNNDCQRRQR